MIYFKILFLWSVIGVIPYQLIILRPWARDRRNEIGVDDFYKALPFGLIILVAFLIVCLPTMVRHNARY